MTVLHENNIDNPVSSPDSFLDELPSDLRNEVEQIIEAAKEEYSSYLREKGGRPIPVEWREDIYTAQSSEEARETLALEVLRKYLPSLSDEERASSTPEDIHQYHRLQETVFDSITSVDVMAIGHENRRQRKSDEPLSQEELVTRLASAVGVDLEIGKKNNSKNSTEKKTSTEKPEEPVQRPKIIHSDLANPRKATSAEPSNGSDDSVRNNYENIVEKDEVETIDELVEGYATKLAKKHDRTFGQLLHKSDYRESKDLQDELGDMMGAIATQLMIEADNNRLGDDDRDEWIAAELSRVTDKVIARSAELRLEAFNSVSPVRKFLYNKWEQWGSEGKKGKVKQSVALAVPGVLAGAGAGVVVGAAVGVGAGAALLTAGSRSLGRGLIRNQLNKRHHVSSTKDAHAKEIGDVVSDFVTKRTENAHKRFIPKSRKGASSYEMLGSINASTEKYRKRNRNQMLGGVGIAMSVGLVSSALADYIGDGIFGGSPSHAADRPAGIGSEVDNHTSRLDTAGRQDLGEAYMGSGRDGGGITSHLNASGRQDLGEAVMGERSVASPREMLFEGYHGTRQLTPEGKQEIMDSLRGHRVKSGESIWSLSEKMLKEQGVKNPSVYEIDATKDMLLHELQRSGSVDTTGMLRAGQVLKFRK